MYNSSLDSFKEQKKQLIIKASWVWHHKNIRQHNENLKK